MEIGLKGLFIHANTRPFRKSLWKGTALLVLFCFTTTTVAWSDPGFTSLNSYSAIARHPLTNSLKNIALPERLGKIDEVFLPEKMPPDSPFVVYLQDAHSNLGAQRRIAEVTRELADKLKIETILVEGGSSEADLSELRAFPNQEIKGRATEFWLKEAVLTGVEREAIVGPKIYRFFGIENEELYEKGGRYFIEAQSRSTSFLDSLRPLVQENEKNRKKYFNKRLYEFEELISKFEEKTELVSLVSLLANKARNLHINRWKYLEIEKLIDLIILEMNSSESERFFEIQRTLDPRKLFAELESLKSEVKERLFQTDAERAIDEEHQVLRALQAIVSLKASPADFDYFLKRRELITKYVEKAKVDLTALTSAEAFYRSAHERDRKMFENIRAILGENRIKRAILVTGGFHARGLTGEFRKHNIPYVLITPQLSDEDNYANYLARISGKRADINAFKAVHPTSEHTSSYATPHAVFNRAEVRVILESFKWMNERKLLSSVDAVSAKTLRRAEVRFGNVPKEKKKPKFQFILRSLMALMISFALMLAYYRALIPKIPPVYITSFRISIVFGSVGLYGGFLFFFEDIWPHLKRKVYKRFKKLKKAEGDNQASEKPSSSEDSNRRAEVRSGETVDQALDSTVVSLFPILRISSLSSDRVSPSSSRVSRRSLESLDTASSRRDTLPFRTLILSSTVSSLRLLPWTETSSRSILVSRPDWPSASVSNFLSKASRRVPTSVTEYESTIFFFGLAGFGFDISNLLQDGFVGTGGITGNLSEATQTVKVLKIKEAEETLGTTGVSLADEVVSDQKANRDQNNDPQRSKHVRIHRKLLPFFRFHKHSAYEADHHEDERRHLQPNRPSLKKVADEAGTQDKLTETRQHTGKPLSFIGPKNPIHNLSEENGPVKNERKPSTEFYKSKELFPELFISDAKKKRAPPRSYLETPALNRRAEARVRKDAAKGRISMLSRDKTRQLIAELRRTPELHERLRIVRWYLGMSQEDLANRPEIPVGQGSIYAYESRNPGRRRDPSAEYVNGLAELAGLDTALITGGKVLKSRRPRYPDRDSVLTELHAREKNGWLNYPVDLLEGKHKDDSLYQAARRFNVPLPRKGGLVFAGRKHPTFRRPNLVINRADLSSTIETSAYGVLGLPFGASQREIKNAYRRSAKRFHPDMRPEGDAEALKRMREEFNRIKAAYEAINSPEKQANYDRALLASVQHESKVIDALEAFLEEPKNHATQFDERHSVRRIVIPAKEIAIELGLDPEQAEATIPFLVSLINRKMTKQGWNPFALLPPGERPRLIHGSAHVSRPAESGEDVRAEARSRKPEPVGEIVTEHTILEVGGILMQGAKRYTILEVREMGGRVYISMEERQRLRKAKSLRRDRLLRDRLRTGPMKMPYPREFFNDDTWQYLPPGRAETRAHRLDQLTESDKDATFSMRKVILLDQAIYKGKASGEYRVATNFYPTENRSTWDVSAYSALAPEFGEKLKRLRVKTIVFQYGGEQPFVPDEKVRIYDLTEAVLNFLLEEQQSGPHGYISKLLPTYFSKFDVTEIGHTKLKSDESPNHRKEYYRLRFLLRWHFPKDDLDRVLHYRLLDVIPDGSIFLDRTVLRLNRKGLLEKVDQFNPAAPQSGSVGKAVYHDLLKMVMDSLQIESIIIAFDKRAIVDKADRNRIGIFLFNMFQVLEKRGRKGLPAFFQYYKTGGGLQSDTVTEHNGWTRYHFVLRSRAEVRSQFPGQTPLMPDYLKALAQLTAVRFKEHRDKEPGKPMLILFIGDPGTSKSRIKDHLARALVKLGYKIVREDEKYREGGSIQLFQQLKDENPEAEIIIHEIVRDLPRDIKHVDLYVRTIIPDPYIRGKRLRQREAERGRKDHSDDDTSARAGVYAVAQSFLEVTASSYPNREPDIVIDATDPTSFLLKERDKADQLVQDEFLSVMNGNLPAAIEVPSAPVESLSSSDQEWEMIDEKAGLRKGDRIRDQRPRRFGMAEIVDVDESGQQYRLRRIVYRNGNPVAAGEFSVGRPDLNGALRRRAEVRFGNRKEQAKLDRTELNGGDDASAVPNKRRFQQSDSTQSGPDSPRPFYEPSVSSSLAGYIQILMKARDKMAAAMRQTIIQWAAVSSLEAINPARRIANALANKPAVNRRLGGVQRFGLGTFSLAVMVTQYVIKLFKIDIYFIIYNMSSTGRGWVQFPYRIGTSLASGFSVRAEMRAGFGWLRGQSERDRIREALKELEERAGVRLQKFADEWPEIARSETRSQKTLVKGALGLAIAAGGFVGAAYYLSKPKPGSVAEFVQEFNRLTDLIDNTDSADVLIGVVRNAENGPIHQEAAVKRLVRMVEERQASRDQVVSALMGEIERYLNDDPDSATFESSWNVAVAAIYGLPELEAEAAIPNKSVIRLLQRVSDSKKITSEAVKKAAQEAMQILEAKADPSEPPRRVIRLPRSKSKLRTRLKGIRRDLTQELGREPTTEEWASRAGLSERKLTALMSAAAGPRSLDQPLPSSDPRYAITPDTKAETPDSIVAQREQVERSPKQIHDLLRYVDFRRQLVVKMAHGLGTQGEKEWSFTDLGQKLGGLTRERPRQLYESAMKKMRSQSGRGSGKYTVSNDHAGVYLFEVLNIGPDHPAFELLRTVPIDWIKHLEQKNLLNGEFNLGRLEAAVAKMRSRKDEDLGVAGGKVEVADGKKSKQIVSVIDPIQRSAPAFSASPDRSEARLSRGAKTIKLPAVRTSLRTLLRLYAVFVYPVILLLLLLISYLKHRAQEEGVRNLNGLPRSLIIATIGIISLPAIINYVMEKSTWFQNRKRLRDERRRAGRMRDESGPNAQHDREEPNENNGSVEKRVADQNIVRRSEARAEEKGKKKLYEIALEAELNPNEFKLLLDAAAKEFRHLSDAETAGVNNALGKIFKKYRFRGKEKQMEFLRKISTAVKQLKAKGKLDEEKSTFQSLYAERRFEAASYKSAGRESAAEPPSADEDPLGKLKQLLARKPAAIKEKYALSISPGVSLEELRTFFLESGYELRKWSRDGVLGSLGFQQNVWVNVMKQSHRSEARSHGFGRQKDLEFEFRLPLAPLAEALPRGLMRLDVSRVPARDWLRHLKLVLELVENKVPRRRWALYYDSLYFLLWPFMLFLDPHFIVASLYSLMPFLFRGGKRNFMMYFIHMDFRNLIIDLEVFPERVFLGSKRSSWVKKRILLHLWRFLDHEDREITNAAFKALLYAGAYQEEILHALEVVRDGFQERVDRDLLDLLDVWNPERVRHSVRAEVRPEKFPQPLAEEISGRDAIGPVEARSARPIELLDRAEMRGNNEWPHTAWVRPSWIDSKSLFSSEWKKLIRKRGRWLKSIYPRLSKDAKEVLLYPSFLLVFMGVKPAYHRIAEKGDPDPVILTHRYFAGMTDVLNYAYSLLRENEDFAAIARELNLPATVLGAKAPGSIVGRAEARRPAQKWSSEYFPRGAPISDVEITRRRNQHNAHYVIEKFQASILKSVEDLIEEEQRELAELQDSGDLSAQQHEELVNALKGIRAAIMDYHDNFRAMIPSIKHPYHMALRSIDRILYRQKLQPLVRQQPRLERTLIDIAESLGRLLEGGSLEDEEREKALQNAFQNFLARLIDSMNALKAEAPASDDQRSQRELSAILGVFLDLEQKIVFPYEQNPNPTYTPTGSYYLPDRDPNWFEENPHARVYFADITEAHGLYSPGLQRKYIRQVIDLLERTLDRSEARQRIPHLETQPELRGYDQQAASYKSRLTSKGKPWQRASVEQKHKARSSGVSAFRGGGPANRERQPRQLLQAGLQQETQNSQLLHPYLFPLVRIEPENDDKSHHINYNPDDQEQQDRPFGTKQIRSYEGSERHRHQVDQNPLDDFYSRRGDAKRRSENIIKYISSQANNDVNPYSNSRIASRAEARSSDNSRGDGSAPADRVQQWEKNIAYVKNMLGKFFEEGNDLNYALLLFGNILVNDPARIDYMETVISTLKEQKTRRGVRDAAQKVALTRDDLRDLLDWMIGEFAYLGSPPNRKSDGPVTGVPLSSISKGLIAEIVKHRIPKKNFYEAGQAWNEYQAHGETRRIGFKSFYDKHFKKREASWSDDQGFDSIPYQFLPPREHDDLELGIGNYEGDGRKWITFRALNTDQIAGRLSYSKHVHGNARHLFYMELELVNNRLIAHTHRYGRSWASQLRTSDPQLYDYLKRLPDKAFALLIDRLDEVLAAFRWPSADQIQDIEIVSASQVAFDWSTISAPTVMTAYMDFPQRHGFPMLERRPDEMRSWPGERRRWIESAWYWSRPLADMKNPPKVHIETPSSFRAEVRDIGLESWDEASGEGVFPDAAGFSRLRGLEPLARSPELLMQEEPQLSDSYRSPPEIDDQKSYQSGKGHRSVLKEKTAESTTRPSGLRADTANERTKPISKVSIPQFTADVNERGGHENQTPFPLGNPRYRLGPHTGVVSPSASADHLTQKKNIMEINFSRLNISDKSKQITAVQNRLIVTLEELRTSDELRRQLEEVLEAGPNFIVHIVDTEFRHELLAERELLSLFGKDFFVRYAVELHGRETLNISSEISPWAVLNRAIDEARGELGLHGSSFSPQVIASASHDVLSRLGRHDTPLLVAEPPLFDVARRLFDLENAQAWFRDAAGPEGILHPWEEHLRTLMLTRQAQVAAA